MELKTSTCCALTSVDHVSWQRGVFELISHLGTAHGFIDGKYSKCLFMITVSAESCLFSDLESPSCRRR